MTKTPEEWLQEASPEKPRGIFKLFLGYAPGVGKTYNMLSEAIRRASRGEDVVVGVVESHGRKATAELAGKLDRVSPLKLEYKGTIFEEMDVDAILARKPTVAVIDELAHTNIEGSKHPKRYQDVIELLFDLCHGKTAVLPRFPDGQVEHLHAVYHTRSALEASQLAIEENRFDFPAMIDHMGGVRYISTLVIQELNPDLRTLFTVNTPLDLKRAQGMLGMKPRKSR